MKISYFYTQTHRQREKHSVYWGCWSCSLKKCTQTDYTNNFKLKLFSNVHTNNQIKNHKLKIHRYTMYAHLHIHIFLHMLTHTQLKTYRSSGTSYTRWIIIKNINYNVISLLSPSQSLPYPSSLSVCLSIYLSPRLSLKESLETVFIL